MTTVLKPTKRFKKKKAIVTVSGGLDSAVTLALALEKRREVIALFIDYGQPCEREFEMHRKLVLFYAENGHKIYSQKCKIELPVNVDYSPGKMEGYVPFRNAIILSMAFSLAESLGCSEVWNGIHHGVRSPELHSFPDATWEFIRSFELMVTLGSVAGTTGKRIKLVSPLLTYSKTGVVRTGFNYGVPFNLTWSCWNSGEKPCGTCASCKGRAEAFAEAKLIDPQTC